MVKKFSIPCIFGNQTSPFTFYIGDPEPKNHPLDFQAKWLQDNRGGQVVPEVWEGLQKVKDLSDKHGIPLQELCMYAIESVNKDGESEEQAE